VLCSKEKSLSVNVVSDGCSLVFDPWQQVCCGVSDGMSQNILCVSSVEGGQWH